MSNENTCIHDFDFKLICEYFSTLERQGPGSPVETLKALQFIDNLDTASRIADLGCGTGGQTMVLAQHVPGRITGIDIFPDFIHLFNQNAERLNLQERVHGQIGSMDNLSFADEELDLIWSEGAIYNIGFERGLKEWNRYLKTGGYIAVTEATWFTPERPQEIHNYWMDAYPQIDTIPNKVAQMEKAGYIPVATFILPENCWIEHFYMHQVAARNILLKKYPNNKTVETFIEHQCIEEHMYNTYKAFYGYVFYIGKKR